MLALWVIRGGCLNLDLDKRTATRLPFPLHPLELIATPHQHCEICVKFSVSRTICGVKLCELLRFGHLNPGKCGTRKIHHNSRQISRHPWQRKTEKKFTPCFCTGVVLRRTDGILKLCARMPPTPGPRSCVGISLSSMLGLQ